MITPRKIEPEPSTPVRRPSPRFMEKVKAKAVVSFQPNKPVAKVAELKKQVELVEAPKTPDKEEETIGKDGNFINKTLKNYKDKLGMQAVFEQNFASKSELRVIARARVAKEQGEGEGFDDDGRLEEDEDEDEEEAEIMPVSRRAREKKEGDRIRALRQQQEDARLQEQGGGGGGQGTDGGGNRDDDRQMKKASSSVEAKPAMEVVPTVKAKPTVEAKPAVEAKRTRSKTCNIFQ